MSGMANKVIVLRNEGMGTGDSALGETILASFLRLVLESADRPRAIFCYNGGVKLLVDGSPVVTHLQAIADLGVPVQACKTCVDFFGIRDGMKVGEVSTMGQFVEYVQNYEIVTL